MSKSSNPARVEPPGEVTAFCNSLAVCVDNANVLADPSTVCVAISVANLASNPLAMPACANASIYLNTYAGPEPATAENIANCDSARSTLLPR